LPSPAPLLFNNLLSRGAGIFKIYLCGLNKEKVNMTRKYVKRRVTKKWINKELDLKINLARYNVFIKAFDGNIDKWKEHLKKDSSIDPVIDDYQFVFWLEKKLKEDTGLLNRIKEMLKQVEKEF